MLRALEVQSRSNEFLFWRVAFRFDELRDRKPYFLFFSRSAATSYMALQALCLWQPRGATTAALRALSFMAVTDGAFACMRMRVLLSVRSDCCPRHTT